MQILFAFAVVQFLATLPSWLYQELFFFLKKEKTLKKPFGRKKYSFYTCDMSQYCHLLTEICNNVLLLYSSLKISFTFDLFHNVTLKRKNKEHMRQLWELSRTSGKLYLNEWTTRLNIFECFEFLFISVRENVMYVYYYYVIISDYVTHG